MDVKHCSIQSISYDEYVHVSILTIQASNDKEKLYQYTPVCSDQSTAYEHNGIKIPYKSLYYRIHKSSYKTPVSCLQPVKITMVQHVLHLQHTLLQRWRGGQTQGCIQVYKL